MRPTTRAARIAITLGTLGAPGALGACTPPPPPAGTEIHEEFSQLAFTRDLEPCKPTHVVATLALSLKKASPYNLERLVAEPVTTVKKGNVAVRIVSLTTSPGWVRWTDLEREGILVKFDLEVTARSDKPNGPYEAVVWLPHAEELSYWGGLLTPKVTVHGGVRGKSDPGQCPESTMPKAPPPKAETVDPGFFRSGWSMVRGFTKAESIAASLTIPIAIWLAGFLGRRTGGLTALIASLVFLALIPLELFALVRAIFIWP